MAARPKIALVGGDGGRSGVPRHISHLFDVLSDRADVTVISDLDRGGYGFAMDPAHVIVPGLATSLNPVAALRAGRGLARALRQIAPDLVWAHARMALPLSRWITRRGDLGRLMVTYHGLPFGSGHGAVKSLISKGIEETSLRISVPHDVVFLTEEDRAAMTGRLRNQRQHVLPNCSWLGGFQPPVLRAGPRRLVMLTRDSAQKNLDLAARVFGALGPGFTLDIYGMGTDAPALQARFATILPPEVLARVLFGGDLDDVRAVLADADGLLVTSRYEGLSISMIEAMEMGLPLFSTPVGGTALLSTLNPLFGALGADLTEGAAVIDQITQTYRADPAGWAMRIHDAWASKFAPPLWAAAVHDLVDQVLGGRRP